MTFKHKLSRRLALLFSATAVVALAMNACEIPIATSPPADVGQLLISPKTATVQPNQDVMLTAVALTPQGDTAQASVSWSATGGSITDTSTNGKRHYGHWKNASCGTSQVTATSHPGGKSDTAILTVTCPTPVASVSVAPAAASVQVSGTVQLTATPKDANGTPLSGRTVTWASSNTSVASVTGSGLVTGAAAGSATITATSEGHNGTASITVANVPVGSVSVSPATASLQVNGAVQLVATPKDANGTPLSGRAVSWSSSNTSVATVSSSGVVTGAAAGAATITATSEGQSGSATVTVQAPQPGCSTSSLAWLNSPFTAQTGSFTAQFDATPNGASIDGVTGLSAGAAAGYADLAAIVRFNAAGQIDARNGAAYAAASAIPYTAGTTYRFRLVVDVPSHTYAAYVTPAGGTEATIGTGYAFRTEQAAVASLANSTVYSDAGTHTVCNFAITGTTPPVSVATVDVTPATANVTVGGTVQLVATPRDANGTPLSGRTVSWSSSNTGVASVTGSGLVTGVGAGSATITATSEGKSGTSAITVTFVPVASVAVTPASASVNEGKTVQLTATPKDGNGNPLSGRAVAWVSSNTTVATVSSSGLVTGKVAGTATITATSEGQSGTSAITVVHVPVASVTVAPPSATVQVGSTVQLTATPKDAGGNPLTGRTVTWASSNTSVATVSPSGLVSGATVGSATITATSEGQSGTATITVVAASGSVVFVGAGDIADCSGSGDEATAALLDNIAGTVFTAGDNVYPDGTDAQFTQCYDPSWGRHKARTRPTPGNHDYHTSGASGYYGYFGSLAGPSGQGYYSYDLGAWHLISLNSNASMSAGSAQETWLRQDLAASTKQCTIAYWHHPRFSSGTQHGSLSSAEPLWQALYDAGADIVISGHEHNYERFAPQTPTGTADPTRGIREFVVGTGGESHYNDQGTPLPNSELFNGTTFGVLKLTLSAGSYTWQFIPVSGGTFTDSGSGSCH